jgi:hypothetical protein
MFKKNDYIVCLEGDFTIDNKPSKVAKRNYCVKQKEDRNHLSLFINVNGKIESVSNHDFTFNRTDKLKDWRYATPTEISIYDKLGRPFDVTELVNFENKKSDYNYLIPFITKLNNEYNSRTMVLR